jgi:uncharacterized protein (DUF1330 family)
MRMRYGVAMVMCVATALGAAAVTGLRAQPKPPVYIVIEVSEMLDAEAFAKAVSTAPTFDGRYIIRSQKVTALDGEAPPTRFVVLAFDSEEKAKVWRDSPAIKEVNAVRLRTTKSRSFMVDGLAN